MNDARRGETDDRMAEEIRRSEIAMLKIFVNRYPDEAAESLRAAKKPQTHKP